MNETPKDAEIRQSIERLKKTADLVNNERAQYDFERSDVIKDVIKCILTFVISFVWLMMMLLIISFVTLGYLQFKIGPMIAASIIFGVVIGLWRTFSTVRKYKGKRIRKPDRNASRN